MSNTDQKSDNLLQLLDGVSLLDDLDRERVIGMVDTLDCAEQKIHNALFSDGLPLKTEISSVYDDR